MDIEVQDILQTIYCPEIINISSPISLSSCSRSTISSNDYHLYMNDQVTYDEEIFSSQEDIREYDKDISMRNNFYFLSEIGTESSSYSCNSDYEIR